MNTRTTASRIQFIIYPVRLSDNNSNNRDAGDGLAVGRQVCVIRRVFLDVQCVFTANNKIFIGQSIK